MVAEKAPATKNDPYLPLEYDGVNIPECSEDEAKLRNIELGFEDLCRKENVEVLHDLSGSRALRKIDKIVSHYVLEEAKKLQLAKEGKGLTFQKIEKALKRDWSNVEDDSSEKFALRELIAKTNRLTFQLIKQWIENAGETGFTEVAELEYELLGPGMAASDRIFIKMTLDNPPIDSDERKRRGMTNECAVVRQAGNEIVEVPLHKAYAEETQIIGEQYRKLILSLKARLGAESTEAGERDESLCDLLERKIAYYDAVLNAITTSDPEKWLIADSLLAQQIRDGNDVFHVHQIETSYMKDAIVRAPDLSLRAPDLDESEAQSRTFETKARMLESLRGSYFADLPAVEKSLSIVERSNTAVRHSVGGGSDMDLKPAGQIIPNEAEARIQGGVDSSLDVNAVREKADIAVKAFKRIFGEKVFKEKIEPIVDINETVGSDITSHELGHPIGIIKGLGKRISIPTFLGTHIEEWKATAGGVLANYYVPVKENKYDPDILRKWVLKHIMTACRYAEIRNNSGGRPYFRKSMMLMKVAEETGILQHDGTDGEFPWKINDEPPRIEAFFEKLYSQFREVMGIYDEGNEDALSVYLEQNLQPTPFVEFVCSKIECPEADKYTPEFLSKLPRDFEEERKELEKLPDEQTQIREALGEVLKSE